MKVAGDSARAINYAQNSSNSPQNPWLRGIQTPSNIPMQIPAENPEPINECAASPPNDDISVKILRQIEFYFSDANILKDQFMLKSVKSAKDGWMKLSIISGFKRIASLNVDEEVMKDAIKSSTLVELSQDGLKIRRKNPLPPWDRLVYNRTILISAFAVDEVVSVDSVTNVFKTINIPVVLGRIIDPGKQIPPYLTKSQSIHGFIGTERCAIVEFENYELANQACRFARTVWPKCHSVILSYNPNKGTTPKEKLSNDKLKDRRKEKTTKSSPLSRPQIILTSCKDTSVRVILTREPKAPPSEEYLGFDAGWRDALCLQQLKLIKNELECPHEEDTDNHEEVTSGSALSSSQIPSTDHTPSLMFLDEAIVSLIPSLASPVPHVG